MATIFDRVATNNKQKFEIFKNDMFTEEFEKDVCAKLNIPSLDDIHFPEDVNVIANIGVYFSKYSVFSVSPAVFAAGVAKILDRIGISYEKFNYLGFPKSHTKFEQFKTEFQEKFYNTGDAERLTPNGVGIKVEHGGNTYAFDVFEGKIVTDMVYFYAKRF